MSRPNLPVSNMLPPPPPPISSQTSSTINRNFVPSQSFVTPNRFNTINNNGNLNNIPNSIIEQSTLPRASPLNNLSSQIPLSNYSTPLPSNYIPSSSLTSQISRPYNIGRRGEQEEIIRENINEIYPNKQVRFQEQVETIQPQYQPQYQTQYQTQIPVSSYQTNLAKSQIRNLPFQNRNYTPDNYLTNLSQVEESQTLSNIPSSYNSPQYNVVNRSGLPSYYTNDTRGIGYTYGPFPQMGLNSQLPIIREEEITRENCELGMPCPYIQISHIPETQEVGIQPNYGFAINGDKVSEDNQFFIRVLYTLPNLQFYVTRIKQVSGIKIEPESDQVFEVTSGNGVISFNNNINFQLMKGALIIVPKGVSYEFINSLSNQGEDLVMKVIATPPLYPPGFVQEQQQ